MGRERWLIWAAIVCAAAIVAAAVLTSYSGYPAGIRVRARFALCVMAVGIVGTLRVLAYVFGLWRSGVESPIAAIRADWLGAALAFAPIVVGICLIGLFIQSMSQIKSTIPAVVPYWADGYLAAFDRTLFGSIAPMARALQPAMPYLDTFYLLWHLVNLGGIVWVLLWRNPEKGRLIVAYMLTWAVGMLVAFLGASMGPIFTGEFPKELAPQLVRETSSALWANYQARGTLVGGGISAFPSMHVAIAMWFYYVLAAKGLRLTGTLYVSATFACSVILGWHYSLDGVAGIIIAWGCHALASRLDTVRFPAFRLPFVKDIRTA